ncbi:MAG TPA: alternative ribosome rescue aminoacyl-tRNA hydrolase ArfB [Pirellulaceae bacterium]|jgi:ribosome-associated protein|nr:alternative ribosome rescue aminoacyl-tRNA hydrolase ArfB [Pirellulaceae bacterium]
MTDLPIPLPEDEFSWSFVRSQGPGGQNVNKVNSKAVLRWNVRDSSAIPAGPKMRFTEKFANRIAHSGDLILTSDRYRDQPKNVEDCRTKLTEMLQSVWAAPKFRRPIRISKGAKERRLRAKKQRSEKKAGRKNPLD